MASVVLLHGLARRSRSMKPLERALVGAGYRTLNLDYDSRHATLSALAQDVGSIIAAFARPDEPTHFVTHSMGGLLARLSIACRRPPNLGGVVMLGPPNQGSPLADWLHRSRAFRAVFGPAGQDLTGRNAAALQAHYGPVDYAVGVIAGTRSMVPLASALLFREASDGKVPVSSTRLDGMADHLALPVMHAFMMCDPAVIAATLRFLRNGRFR